MKVSQRAVLVGGSSHFLFVESLLQHEELSSAVLLGDSFYAGLFEARQPKAVKVIDEFGFHLSIAKGQLKCQGVSELICLLSPEYLIKFASKLREIKKCGITLIGLIPDVAQYKNCDLQDLFSSFIVLSQKDVQALSYIQDKDSIIVLSEFASWGENFRKQQEFLNNAGEKFKQLFSSETGDDKSNIRVLMNIRENAFSSRGGDTVLLECLKGHLEDLGVNITVDETGTVDPSDFDLVHTFNFATPDITENFARRAVEAGTPFVVTTLNEDRPRYFNQMFALFSVMEIYLKQGQVRELWREYEKVCSITRPGPIWDNSYTATHAAALIATGQGEADVLHQYYPDTAKIEVVTLGTDTLSQKVDDGELFRREMGLSDFVLCVGRLERRKNQLMLLKALEDTDHTVVFATSGMTYEPEYVEAVKNFQRKGKTVFFPALEKDMLISCFAAARVHVLPSWYELPGLVHLEAAQQGTPVVVTDYGTTRDYLGDDAFYCSPDSAGSIRQAIEQAWDVAQNDPQRIQRLQDRVASFTWKSSAEKTLDVYREILSGKTVVAQEPAHIEPALNAASDKAYQASRSVSIIPRAMPSGSESSTLLKEADEICIAADQQLIAGESAKAKEQYEEALELVPRHCKAMKGLGVIAMMEQDYHLAESCFDKVIQENASDAKAIAGKAACLSAFGRSDEAYKLYIEAVRVEPLNVSALFHLINVSYELNKFSDLETALRRYLVERSDDIEMRYCLAGCYLAQQKFPLAMATIERILQLKPEHEQAIELRDEIKRQRDKKAFPEQDGKDESALNVRILIERIDDLKARREYDDVVRQIELAESMSGISESEMDKIKIIKGESLACLEKFDEAESCFASLVTSRIYGDRACAGLGVIAAARGSWDAARGHFTEALKRNNKNDTALAGIALCDGSVGEKEKAWSNYQKALGVNNENKRALLGLVELGYELQRLPVVEAALSQYLEMHPLDLSMLYTAAGCCYAQGKVDEALEKLNTIILVDSGHEYANELLQRINSDVVAR